MTNAFTERLTSSAPIVFDGGMGTELAALGAEPGTAATLNAPTVVEQIHRAYRDAGAEVILTNTFSANRAALSRSGSDETLPLLIAEACRVARSALLPEGLFLAGDIGPTGEFVEPVGSLSREEMRRIFAESAEHLAAGGVHLFVIETMSDLAEITLAIEACRQSAAAVPVAATMSFDPVRDGFRTNTGVSPEKAAKALTEAGADIVGANCGSVGPEQLVQITRLFRDNTDQPILIQSNAGLPVLSGDTVTYNLSPNAFAEGMLRVHEAGANLLGGCCGTTPEHIRALSALINK